jgi:hypothetical protein
MGSIYLGAQCNIAATGSRNPYGGLYARDRRPEGIVPLRVAIPTANAKGETSMTWYDVGDDFGQDWVANVSHRPLGTRAWIMQERLLAPRVVHFAKTQLYWECVTRRTCEGNEVAGIPDINNTNSLVEFKQWDPFDVGITASKEAPTSSNMSCRYMIYAMIYAMRAMLNDDMLVKDMLTQMATNGFDSEESRRTRELCFGTGDCFTTTHPTLQYWAKMVAQYSRCPLTKLEDRLVGISSLAKILSKSSDLRYIAGLWEHQLPRQLLWEVGTVFEAKQPSQYIAPTWSWASAPVAYATHLQLHPNLDGKTIDLIKVMEVSVTGITGEADAFGEVTSGNIRLRGRLIPLDVRALIKPASSSNTSRTDRLLEHWNLTAKSPPVGDIFVVPVLFMLWEHELPINTPNALLLEATGTARGIFRRIGTARLNRACPLRWIADGFLQDRSYDYGEDGSWVTLITNIPDLEPSSTSTVPDAISEPPGKPPTLRQAFLKSRGESTFTGVDKPLGILSQRIQAAMESKPQDEKIAKAQFTIDKLQLMLARVMDNRPAAKPHSQVRSRLMEMGMDENIASRAEKAVEAKKKRLDGKPVERRPRPAEERKDPRRVIDDKFWLECLDDEDSVRYGHFVFDII